MKEINVTEGIVPLGEFKTQASRFIRQLHASSSPLIVTQNGRPAAVVLAPAAYQALRERHEELEAIAAGLAQADAGEVVPHGTVEKWLASWGTAREKTRPA